MVHPTQDIYKCIFRVYMCIHLAIFWINKTVHILLIFKKINSTLIQYHTHACVCTQARLQLRLQKKKHEKTATDKCGSNSANKRRIYLHNQRINCKSRKLGSGFNCLWHCWIWFGISVYRRHRHRRSASGRKKKIPYGDSTQIQQKSYRL